MKDRPAYRIKVQGVLIDVTKEIYLTYYRMARRAKHLNEKDELHGVVSYNELDTDGLLGQETMPDLNSESVEDMATHTLMYEKLHQCLKLLSKSEQELIHALYFDGKSEHQLFRETGIPQKTIHNRKVRILRKLKNFMEK